MPLATRKPIRSMGRAAPTPRHLDRQIFGHTCSARSKWIQHLRAETGYVAVVAGHQCQPIDRGRGCQEAVDHRSRSQSAHPSPSMGHSIVDSKHTTVECDFNLTEPSFERRSLARVVYARKFNSLADVSENERAQKHLRIGDRRVPFHDVRIAPLALANLGDDVGIEQIAHRSTLRPRSRARSKSMPSSGADASSAFKLTLAGAENRCRKSARASARRLGSDRAAATPRTRGASFLRTLISTRTNPARALRAR